jgi:hypothetical protein
VEHSSKEINTYMFCLGQVVTHSLKEFMAPGAVYVAKDSPFLAGSMAVWLASELSEGVEDRNLLGGRYLSAIWDFEGVNSRKDEILRKDIFKLRLDM